MNEDLCGVGTIFPVLQLVFRAIQILYVVIPVALIIFSLIDLSKLVMLNNLNDEPKSVKLILKKIIYALSIFIIVPLIISMFLSLVSEHERYDCIEEIFSDLDLLVYNYEANDEEAMEKCIKNNGIYYEVPFNLFDENSVSTDFTINGDNVYVCVNGQID